MTLSPLTAISPIDGRYRSQVAVLAPYFSELGLIRYRVRIEIEYFIALCEWQIPQLAGVDPAQFPALRALYETFTEADALRIKEIEKTTNHDVKAVEYFIKEKLKGSPVEPYLEFIHFGLTSQDINNTAIPLLLREALRHGNRAAVPAGLHALAGISRTVEGHPHAGPHARATRIAHAVGQGDFGVCGARGKTASSAHDHSNGG